MERLRLLFSDLAGPVNIGNPHEMTILELANLVRELTGSDSELQFIERAQDDPSQRRPDITLARSELHWAPKVDVRDGLTETIAWFRDGRDRTAGRFLDTASEGDSTTALVTRLQLSAPVTSVRLPQPAWRHLATTCVASTPIRYALNSSTTGRCLSTSRDYPNC